MFAMVCPGYGIAHPGERGDQLARAGVVSLRDTVWHADVTPLAVDDANDHPEGAAAMTLPTREQLNAEADRRYFLRYPDAPRVVDPDDGARDPCEAAWLEIREEVLAAWTDEAFYRFFPTAGRLEPGDVVLIEYWNDIKDQIAGRPGRWSWDEPPAGSNDAAMSIE
jgi:hypothetical protein